VGADLVVGHSLGAMAVGLAVPALAPRQLVLVDPPWLRPWRELDLTQPLPMTAAGLGAAAEPWDDEDVAAELASNRLLDPEIAPYLLRTCAPDEHIAPAPAHVPGSVVLVPELAPSLPLEAHEAVTALGYEIRTVAGVGHVMHRDDLAAFLGALPLTDEVPA
jgi:hypothetical protein